MLVDIDIITRVLMKKNPYTKCLQIGGEKPQLKVMQALREFSHFFSFSHDEEL